MAIPGAASSGDFWRIPRCVVELVLYSAGNGPIKFFQILRLYSPRPEEKIHVVRVSGAERRTIEFI